MMIEYGHQHLHTLFLCTLTLLMFILRAYSTGVKPLTFPDWAANAVMCSTSAINQKTRKKAAAIVGRYAGPNR